MGPRGPPGLSGKPGDDVGTLVANTMSEITNYKKKRNEKFKKYPVVLTWKGKIDSPNQLGKRFPNCSEQSN